MSNKFLYEIITCEEDAREMFKVFSEYTIQPALRRVLHEAFRQRI